MAKRNTVPVHKNKSSVRVNEIKEQ